MFLAGGRELLVGHLLFSHGLKVGVLCFRWQFKVVIGGGCFSGERMQVRVFEVKGNRR